MNQRRRDEMTWTGVEWEPNSIALGFLAGFIVFFLLPRAWYEFTRPRPFRGKA
jgi:energy-converting hydrogenase Eha subunit G